MTSSGCAFAAWSAPDRVNAEPAPMAGQVDAVMVWRVRGSIRAKLPRSLHPRLATREKARRRLIKANLCDQPITIHARQAHIRNQQVVILFGKQIQGLTRRLRVIDNGASSRNCVANDARLSTSSSTATICKPSRDSSAAVNGDSNVYTISLGRCRRRAHLRCLYGHCSVNPAGRSRQPAINGQAGNAGKPGQAQWTGFHRKRYVLGHDRYGLT